MYASTAELALTNSHAPYASKVSQGTSSRKRKTKRIIQRADGLQKEIMEARDLLKLSFSLIIVSWYLNNTRNTNILVDIRGNNNY